MELPEDSASRSEDNMLPDEGTESSGHYFSFSPETGLPDELATDSGEIELSRDEWTVEVVPGKVSDAANRISRAIEIILSAAQPRE